MHDHKHSDDCQHVQAEEDNTPKCVSEFVSRNENYKAVVYELAHEDIVKYEVVIYKWAEGKAEEEPLWERVAGPIIIDTLPAAETWAQENLQTYAGEKLDLKVSDSLRNEVREALGHEDYDFLDPSSFAVSFLESEDSEEFLPIPHVDKVLVAGNFYFVEFGGAWLAGFLYDEATIRCWKRFDDLKVALKEIV